MVTVVPATEGDAGDDVAVIPVQGVEVRVY
jgi:hypothetical protein